MTMSQFRESFVNSRSKTKSQKKKKQNIGQITFTYRIKMYFNCRSFEIPLETSSLMLLIF